MSVAFLIIERMDQVVPLVMRHGGVLTREQLLSSGLTRRQIQRALRDGSLLKLRHNAYVLKRIADCAAGRPDRQHTLEVAAALAGMRSEDAVASHTSAALMHGLDLLDRPPSGVTLTRPPQGQGRSGSGIAVQAARLPTHHVTRVFGVPVTTVARTVVDLARSQEFAAGLVAADGALHWGMLHEFELHKVIADCRGWPGITKAIRVVGLADKAADSAFESLSRARFIDADLPVPETQVYLPDLPTLRRVDFLWRSHRVVGEADGLGKYRDPGVIADEKLRDEHLRAAGYEPVHWLWKEMRYTPEVVTARIRAAYERSRRLGRR